MQVVTLKDIPELFGRGQLGHTEVCERLLRRDFREVACAEGKALKDVPELLCAGQARPVLSADTRGWLLRLYVRRRGTDSRLFRQREAGFSKSRSAPLCCSGGWCFSSSFSITIDHSGGANEQENSTYVSKI